jgi:hypothetical protein
LRAAKSCSIEFKSGEYGGRYHNWAPLAAINRAVSALLWNVALSNTTTSSLVSKGHNICLSHELKTAVSQAPVKRKGAHKPPDSRRAARSEVCAPTRSGAPTPDLLAARGVTIAARGKGRETALVNIDEAFAAPPQTLSLAQITLSSRGLAFPIAEGLFWRLSFMRRKACQTQWRETPKC